jgi:large conductance mechanosensitive channel
MKIIKEFKEFAMRGNVVDLAIGVVIGGAFGKIVTSLVNDVIMPPLGYILGGVDFADKKWVLQVADVALNKQAVSLNWGLFINAIIDFVIVAFAIFMVIKAMNKLKKPAPETAPTTKDCAFCQSPIPIKAVRCPHCTSQLL